MLGGAVSETPSHSPSPRALARARARGDLPYASELPFALVLLVLAVIGAQPIAAFVHALQGFARASWSGQLSLVQVGSALPGLVGPLLWVVAVCALVAFAGVFVQRAPTLQSRPDRTSPRGRPGLGRTTRAWLSALKIVVLGASLFALVYDSRAGWLAAGERSPEELLEISARALPALFVRAAWVCVLLAGLELAVQYLARLRRLRMTRQQVLDEQRELAGDPRFASERRARASALSPQLRAADLAQLSAAALLITGSACVVALEYSPELGVPRVWLAAEGNHALELLSKAYSLDLPIVADELLASALFRTPLRAAVASEWHARVAELMVTAAKREAS